MRLRAFFRPERQLESAPFLPHRMWRQLLAAPALPPCARLLVLAPQPLALVHWLVELSFDVLAVCEDPEIVLAGRRTVPQADFLRIGPVLKGGLAARTFDAAFLLPMSGHGADWLSLSARRFTAAIAATVTPNGRIITWRSPEMDGHGASCWDWHLGCFPGQVNSVSVTPPLLTGPTTRSLLSVWQLPAEELSLGEWREYAERGLLTDRRGCCAATAHATTVPRAA
jgi:hypothetical protein